MKGIFMKKTEKPQGLLKKFPGIKIGIMTLILLLIVGVSSAFTLEKEIEVSYQGETVVARGKLLESLKEVLVANDLPVSDRYQYSKALSSLFKDVASLKISEKSSGKLLIGQESQVYYAGSITVGDLLAKMKVELGENDRVEPSIDTIISDETGDIRVVRVEIKEESSIREIPMEVSISENESLAIGSRVVKQVGENGKSNVTERVYYENGAEVRRETIKTQIITVPQEEIIEAGPATTVTVPKAVKVKGSSGNVTVEKSEVGESQASPNEETGFTGSMTVEATAYTATGNKTAWGTVPQSGRTIASWGGLPFGTKVYIPALGGVYTVEDRGGAVTYGIIDIFMDSQAECTAWGRQKIEIYFMD